MAKYCIVFAALKDGRTDRNNEDAWQGGSIRNIPLPVALLKYKRLRKNKSFRDVDMFEKREKPDGWEKQEDEIL